MPSQRPTVREAFKKGVDLLQAERVPFVVIGGLAAGLQGEPRYTEDADFMITLSTTKVFRFAEKAKAQGFDVEPDLAETQWLGCGVLRLWLGPPGEQTAVDLMSCNSAFLREVSWRAQQGRCLGIQVPIASREDMLLFKLCAWRIKDVPDAIAIVRRHEEKLDVPYLHKWASWLSEKSPKQLGDVPRRLQALLEKSPLPPPEGFQGGR